MHATNPIGSDFAQLLQVLLNRKQLQVFCSSCLKGHFRSIAMNLDKVEQQMLCVKHHQTDGDKFLANNIYHACYGIISCILISVDSFISGLV